MSDIRIRNLFEYEQEEAVQLLVECFGEEYQEAIEDDINAMFRSDQWIRPIYCGGICESTIKRNSQ